ncbi:CHAT domain-containing protein [uncultured Aquimarina sp.]|uniref:CHAT domain-containing protein n=1 Tax=uncultured Aquimarina sp. TaxID=575652 RepID=UPI00260682DD|nr:CHAT domain-containing protein [uncultured Aquimarina sp.]
MKITLFVLLLALCIFPSYTQEEGQEHIQYTSIISTSIDDNKKEQKLDSFFKQKSRLLPTLDLANCYHDYSVDRYKKWRITNDKKLLKNAIHYAKNSLNIKNKVEGTPQESLDKTLYNLGVFNFQNYEYFNAIDYFSKLIEVGKISKKTKAYNELGSSYIKIGDFHKALNSTEKAFKLCQLLDDNQKSLISLFLLRADIYSIMGYKEYSNEIKVNLQIADSILDLVSFNTIGFNNRLNQIKGNRLLETGKFHEAILVFSKVLESRNPRDSTLKAISYNSLGLSFLRLKQLDTAEINLKNAISHNPKYTAAYENLGDLYIEKKEFKEGLYQYQKAINYAINNYEEFAYNDLIDTEKLEVAVNKYYLLHHLIQKANAWITYYHYDKNQDHLTQALKTFKIADLLVDIIRFESTEYKSKLFWREQGSKLYIKAVETCYLLKKNKEAYYFMEKNKALLLLEDITNEQAKENTKLPLEIAKREFALKQAIYLSENELNNSKKIAKDSIISIKDRVYHNKNLYEKFVDSITKIYPEYAANKKKIIVLPYKAFSKKHISDKEVVLQYILDKNQGYGLLTTSNKSIFFEIKDVPKLQQNIRQLRKQSSDWFRTQEQLTAYQKNANLIFKKLIPQQVYTQLKEKKVTIIPDYTLQQVSFDVLITSQQSDKYLIQDTEIRYAYSMSYLDRKDQIKTTPKHSFIGFAPVTFATKELGDLTLSKKEVLLISDLFNGKTLIEEKATKANFLNTIAEYKIIHLSTHADIGDAIDPWIAFRDKKLTLQEIYATKNQSDMVVLSACKTSLGELEKGEGVMSLARGFFHSGTRSVISSLWSTNDKSNQELMIDFYKGINQGLTKSNALRNAKLNYINTHQGTELSPFYWGSLILIGDNAPIDLSQSINNWYWLFTFFIIALVIFIYYLKKAKNHN